MSPVKPYQQLRNELAQRDRSLREKVVTLEDAASFVQDGDLVGIGGSTMSRTPMALIWALIRARRKKLVCARSIVSTDGDLLFGSGVSRSRHHQLVRQGILWGLSKVMRHHVENRPARGSRNGAIMAIGMRFRAGGMGVPFMPIRLDARLRCSQANGPKPRRSSVPFTGEKLLLVPALNPGRRADPRAALRCLSATRRSTGCSSWTSISPWRRTE